MQQWFSSRGQTCEPHLFHVTVKELEIPSQESSQKSNCLYAKQPITEKNGTEKRIELRIYNFWF